MKHNLLHIGIHFHCLGCEYSTTVTPMFLADCSVPVCPECDDDMKISDKYATLYQDKTEARLKYAAAVWIRKVRGWLGNLFENIVIRQ